MQKKGKAELDTEKGKNIEDDIDLVSDKSEEWSKILVEDGRLIADFNQNGYDDYIQIEYKVKEGSQVISKFKLSISGIEEPFIIKDYDASFVNMEVINIDGDDSDEILLLFDTHGGGGQGTHDVYMVKMLDDAIVGNKIDSYIEGAAQTDKSWHIDGIYRIEKVLYKDIQTLMVHQYVWGEQGHSDEKGDLISLVSLDGDRLIATDSWMNPEN